MRLRRLEQKDAMGMLEWMHDPDIVKNFRNSMKNLNSNDVSNFIKNSDIILQDGKTIHYAVVDEDDEYLGTISLKNIDLVSKNAEYAISLRKKAQGKGIAYQATKELLYLAFCEFQLERVYLNVLGDNSRAEHLYDKCGFRFEGEFINHLFLNEEYKNLKWYAMLKEEYEK